MVDTDPTLTTWQRFTSIPRAVWVLVFALLLFASPILVRCWSLSQVPDLGDPFDVAEFCKVDVPADQNAITVYEAALAKYAEVDIAVMSDPEKPGKDPGGDFLNRNDTPEGVELISAWRAARRDALLEWKRGTSLTIVQPAPPHESEGSIWSKNFLNIPRVTLLARLEAEEWEQRGDMATAWEWHRARFRFSRHLGQKGDLHGRLLGKGVHAGTVDDLVRWAGHSAVTVDQLRQALDEVQTVFATTASWSDVLKHEYIWVNKRLSKITLHELAEEADGLVNGEPILSRQFRLWVVGEPQLMLRLQRQIMANCLHEMDRPLAQRRNPASISPLLFDPAPHLIASPGRLHPAEIKYAIQRSIVESHFWVSDLISKHVSSNEEAGREVVLELVLALQQYRREHGEYPVELSRLVPQYIDMVPIDPCDPAGEPICYRRESPLKARVWSIGHDSYDQGGTEINSSGQELDPGLGFMLK